MKNRNYKRIYRPGTLFRVVGSDAVFMSLGLNPKNPRQIFSYNGMDIVKRKPVIRADGRARPATKAEQQTYWNVLKEFIAQREEDEKRLRESFIHEVNLREEQPNPPSFEESQGEKKEE